MNLYSLFTGEVIALFVEEGEDWKDVEIPERASSAVDEQTTTTRKEETKSTTSSSSAQSNLISPSVRNLLEQYNIDANRVKATGPKNNVLKSDVLGYIQSNNLKSVDLATSKQASSPTSRPSVSKATTSTIKSTKNSYVDIELSSMRRTIAKRLTESKSTIPHAYMNVACNVNNAVEYQTNLKRKKIPVSFNDLIIKAVALALKKVPQVNAIFNADSQQSEPLRSVDISVAVATENGLITPIIRDANRLSIQEINQQVKHLAGKAREGKLQPNEFIGGSFSISNLGNEFNFICCFPLATDIY